MVTSNHHGAIEHHFLGEKHIHRNTIVENSTIKNTETTSITIQANATLGSHRMRVKTNGHATKVVKKLGSWQKRLCTRS